MYCLRAYSLSFILRGEGLPLASPDGRSEPLLHEFIDRPEVAVLLIFLASGKPRERPFVLVRRAPLSETKWPVATQQLNRRMP